MRSLLEVLATRRLTSLLVVDQSLKNQEWSRDLTQLQEVGEIFPIASAARIVHLEKMSYYYPVMTYQGYYPAQNSGTYSDTSWSDVKNELKKAGSSFVEWVSSKLPKGSSKGNPRCFSCQRNGATIKLSGGAVAFCSQKCQHEAMQKYQKELGKACSFYLTVEEGIFIYYIITV